MVSDIREITNQLRTEDISDLNTLLGHLCAPLDALGLLPSDLSRYNVVHSLPKGSVTIARHIPLLQQALVDRVLPVWEDELTLNGLLPVVDIYFCPAYSMDMLSVGEIALHAYSTLLSAPITKSTLRLIKLVAETYTLDKLHAIVFFGFHMDLVRREGAWKDCVRNLLVLPTKVANAVATGEIDILPSLEQGPFLEHVCRDFETLTINVSATASYTTLLPSFVFLLTKLATLGIFPLSPPTLPSQASFFKAVLPSIRRRLTSGHDGETSYTQFWATLINSISSVMTLRSILASLLGHLAPISPFDVSLKNRSLVKTQAQLIRSILGVPELGHVTLWSALSATIFMREWDQGIARVVVCWVSGAQEGRCDEEALGELLSRTVEQWSAQDHIKHSLLSQHQYLTCLLILTLTSLPSVSDHVSSLARNTSFISAVGTYISHPDPAVRRCGMLAAEIAAERASKKLRFDGWDGVGEGREWARALRTLSAGERDADAEVVDEAVSPSIDPETRTSVSPAQEENTSALSRVTFISGDDSDDSLTGYNSPVSSRSASPAPSELEEIERDPSLNIGRKPISRPVYLAQLGELLRPTSVGGLKHDPEDEARKVELGLRVAEELIRRKRDYGTELEENAVNLVHAVISLVDNFELDNFTELRQNTLIALVACCPHKAAPSIIEEFFKNQYSMDQRFTMMNALAFGARELAGLPIPVSQLSANLKSFPSKRLPEHLHKKYIAAGEESTEPVQRLLQDISRDAVAQTAHSAAENASELVRERQLRIRQPAKVVDVTAPRNVPDTSLQRAGIPTPTRQRPTFTLVAAEHFLGPLLARFWSFLRDEQAHEARTAHLEGRFSYRGAGTGLVLSAAVLPHFLATVGVLVHAAHNAPVWGAVLAPSALELALTLGTRPVSLLELEESGEAGSQTREAGVLSAALELAVVVVDGCINLDGARALALEHTGLILGVAEWAGRIFEQLEKGERMRGGGGAVEARLGRAAAGLVLKADEIRQKWGRSMVAVA